MPPKILFYFLLISGILISCNSSEKKFVPYEEIDTSLQNGERKLSEQFKKYWFDGTAEITSYKLQQERYGEIREGTAVTIYVSEDFLPQQQVKANQASDTTYPVLKLNKTKKFITGIYPYSIMTSVFSPLKSESHAAKVSNSVQEWCGMVYMQLNNREDYEITSHSYFEGEADQNFNLEKTWLEDELWNLLRINPEELPSGEISIIPSFEAIRLRHKDIKPYQAIADLKQRDSISIYEVSYPELERDIKIYFESRFPFKINMWEEINAISFTDSLKLKTTATKMKRIKTDYWTQNKNANRSLRDSLGLE